MSTELDRLVHVVHTALGGDGWAYSNYGMNELVSHREKLETVVGALALSFQTSAVAAVEAQKAIFSSPEYATGQPLSSLHERIACDACIDAIRRLAPSLQDSEV